MQPSSFSDPRFLLTQNYNSITQLDLQKDPTNFYLREKIKKIVIAGFGVAGLITTGAFTALEFHRGANAKILAFLLPLNGVSAAVLAHPLISKELRKLIYTISSDLSYPLLFTATQIFLNVVPQQNMAVGVTGFLWWLGAYTGKDLLHSTSLTVSDFALSTEPPEKGQELPLLRPSPRNKKATIIVLSALTTAAIGAHVLYHLYKGDLETGSLGDIQKIGVPQDLIALFSGSVLGEGIAQFADTYKEGLETKHAFRLLSINSLSCGLKSLRIFKSVFMIVTPPVMGVLLAVPLTPNSMQEYACKFAIGSLFGAHQILSRREFTRIRPEVLINVEKNTQNQPLSGIQKVKEVAKLVLPKIILFGSLMAFMLWITANTNSIEINGGIAMLLSSTFISIIMTSFIDRRFQPGTNSRLTNEAAFHYLYYATGFTFLYQYLTTKINIYGDDLSQSSRPVYGLQLFTWGIWGAVMGNIIASIFQKKINPAAVTTHPMTMQELCKTMVLTYFPKNS